MQDTKNNDIETGTTNTNDNTKPAKTSEKFPKSKQSNAFPNSPLEAEKQTRKQQRIEKRNAALAETKTAFIYMGPNLPGGELFTGTVYRQMPDHLEGVFGKMPELKKLFTEVKDMAAFKNDLAEQGSEAHRTYKSIINQLLEDAKKAMEIRKKEDGDFYV